MKNTKKLLIAVVGIGVLLGMQLHEAIADSSSLEELSAEWWQWALSIPTPDNPLLDPTGEKCGVGQQGPVWFIPVSGSGTRTCSVPDKPLAFPTLSYINIDTPYVCGQGPSVSVEELRAAAAAAIDGVTNQSVRLDGHAVGNLSRVQSPVFAVVLPEDNWFDPQCTAYGNVPAGTYSPAIVDGYFVMLDPLEPGEHTLYIHAEMQGSSLDDTWNLTVLATQCAGDCDGTKTVDVTEIIKLVNIILGTFDISACPQGIPAGATPDITLVIQAVNIDLGTASCPAG